MKSLKYAVLLVLVVFMTGCGTQTLTCTSTYGDDDYSYTTTMVAKFKEDSMTSLKATMQGTIDDGDSWDDVKSFYGDIDQSGTGYSVTTTFNDSSQTYKIIVSVDLAKISADDLEELGFGDMPDSTYDEVKVEAEDAGYTCK